MAEGVTMVPFVGGSYDLAARFVSPQRTVNFYPENTSSDARVQQILAPTPGERVLPQFDKDAFNGQKCKALYWSSSGPNGEPCLWAVFGNTLYRIKSLDDSPEQIHGASISAAAVSLSVADNGFLLAIADGTQLLVCELDKAVPVLKKVVLPEVEAGFSVFPTMVAYIAARFVINDDNIGAPKGRNIFLFSNLNSQMPGETNEIEFVVHGTAQAQYYTAEYSADPITAMVVNEGRLWLFGPNSYEVWAPGANSETGDDPFNWVSGATADIGTQAPGSVSQIGESVFWLGGSSSGRNSVYMATGLRQPIRISTNALERRISEIGSSSAAIGFCYTDEGHVFYCMTFDEAGLTVCFDASTELWHERSSRNWTTGEDGAWLPRFPVNGFQQRLFWGTIWGQIAELDHKSGKMLDAADGNEDFPAIRRRIGPVLWSANRRVVVWDLLVDMEVGTTGELKPEDADNPGPNSQNPRAMLRVSRDGGYTWGPSTWRSFGRQGNYAKTVHWMNLGWGRSFVVELSFSEDFPFSIAGLRLGFEECEL